MTTTIADTRALEADLRRQVKGEVRFDAYSRVMYSTDASIYQMEPLGVVIPRRAVSRICGRSGTATHGRRDPRLPTNSA